MQAAADDAADAENAAVGNAFVEMRDAGAAALELGEVVVVDAEADGRVE